MVTSAPIDTTPRRTGRLPALLTAMREERHTMSDLLIPVDGSASALAAVRHVIDEYRQRPDLQVHLLNVQRPLPAYVARFVGSAERRAFLGDQARSALLPAQALLDAARVPYRAHIEIGDKASVIVERAARLRCTGIVMGTARKNSLLRWVESSTTNRVIELTCVPVLIIAGSAVSRAERYGVPAGAGAALATLLYAAAT
ncbi:MAG: hypothetical protein AMXMBFR66_02760 [Pseudomonadota bacterium]|jgi:nucleotide-binding universal stress UspA family protein